MLVARCLWPYDDATGMPIGVTVFDISNPENPRQIGFFDVSGGQSKGTHTIWFVDGRCAHLGTGMPDAVPSHPIDNQFYVIVDMADPARPKESGRWWYPGTQEGEDAPPPRRVVCNTPSGKVYDWGYNLHDAHVCPARPDRAYLAYMDGGVVILDISDLCRPKMLGNTKFVPPFLGMTHSAFPFIDRWLLIVTDEATHRAEGIDYPTMVRVLDIRDETNPVIISACPMPSREDFRGRGGVFGYHQT